MNERKLIFIETRNIEIANFTSFFSISERTYNHIFKDFLVFNINFSFTIKIIQTLSYKCVQFAIFFWIRPAFSQWKINSAIS